VKIVVCFIEQKPGIAFLESWMLNARVKLGIGDLLSGSKLRRKQERESYSERETNECRCHFEGVGNCLNIGSRAYPAWDWDPL
jgi:hypothetical protein